MAKKNKELVACAESKWDGRLLTYIGVGLLQYLVIALMAAIGAAIAVALGVVSIGEEITVAEKFGVMEILGIALAAIFVWLGLCWATIIYIKWDTKHTVVSGQRLVFKAGTLNLFFNQIKWLVLTAITAGIYGLWLVIKVRKWRANHTFSYPEVGEAENDYNQPQINYYTVED